eukprot:TRINITY_DN7234_c0_g1_i5.p1 TRINITY_DN7234_c0_g1~~TRINITY_DN7234_c0_g1_i5.p1  ORF type:complete len:369 (+),score=62.44 TRINITY_DN7234_c0_g1_i5:97-1203(+)
MTSIFVFALILIAAREDSPVFSLRLGDHFEGAEVVESGDDAATEDGSLYSDDDTFEQTEEAEEEDTSEEIGDSETPTDGVDTGQEDYEPAESADDEAPVSVVQTRQVPRRVEEDATSRKMKRGLDPLVLMKAKKAKLDNSMESVPTPYPYPAADCQKMCSTTSSSGRLIKLTCFQRIIVAAKVRHTSTKQAVDLVNQRCSGQCACSLSVAMMETLCSGWSPTSGPLKGMGTYCRVWGRFSQPWCWVAAGYHGPGMEFVKKSSVEMGKWFAPCADTKMKEALGLKDLNPVEQAAGAPLNAAPEGPLGNLPPPPGGSTSAAPAPGGPLNAAPQGPLGNLPPPPGGSTSGAPAPGAPLNAAPQGLQLQGLH